MASQALQRNQHFRELQQTIGNQAVLRKLSHAAVQTKLTVNQAGDPHEQEADRVADQVMRMPEPSMSRKCAQCEEDEKKLQRKEAGAGPVVAPSIVHDVLSSPGRPLESVTREFFEPRLGRDFSDVRVHTDSGAAESTRAVNALAYTVGRDIVFGGGQYRPGTASGDRLLAHELAHVVQQGSASHAVVARQTPPVTTPPVTTPPVITPPVTTAPTAPPATGPLPSDTQIAGASPSSDPASIFFDRNSSAIPTSQTSKIAPLAGTTAADKSRPLALDGYVSEDENAPAATGTALANARIASVDTGLAAAGHTGTRTATPKTTDSVGKSDYRSMRKVAVHQAATPSGTSNCTPAFAVPGIIPMPPGVLACNPPSQFTTAQTRAVALLTPVITALSATPLASTTISELDARFGSTPANRASVAGKVKTNLSNLKTHISTQMTPVSANGTGPGHRCASDCDDVCRSGDAYNQGTDASARMTLCDVPSRSSSFMREPDLDQRAAILIHEGMHGITLTGMSSGSGTQDFSYVAQRLINFLDPATALKNSDSYVIFVRVLNGQNVPVGRSGTGAPAPDVLASGATFSAPEKGEVDRGLAWLEGWTVWAQQGITNLYAAVNEIVENGKQWASVCCQDIMVKVAPHFGLTAPAGTPPAVPTRSDKFAIAGINDRFVSMESVLYSMTALTIDRTPAGATVWSSGPGRTVTIGSDFFAVPTGTGRGRAQLDLLINAIVTATSGISSGAQPHYVKLFDELRTLRGGGTP
jgi:hypothetical protein